MGKRGKQMQDLKDKGYEVIHQDFQSLPMPYPTVSERVKEAITIYPEIISGNPLRSERVVRWVMSYPGKFGGDRTYNKRETIFCYSEDHRDYLGAKCDLLYVPTIDRKIFYWRSGERKGIWEYAGKSKHQGDIGLPQITRCTPDSHEKLAELFRNIEYLISYDDMTATVDEARLCGCPVLLITDQKDRWKRVNCTYGIAFDASELDYAKDTVELYPQAYHKIEIEYEDQLRNFIERTQKL